MRLLLEIVAARAERPGARRIHRAAADWRGLKFELPPREPSDDAAWGRIRLDVGRETTAVLVADRPDAPGREALLADLIGGPDAVARARAGGAAHYSIGLEHEPTDLGLYCGTGLVAAAVAALTDGIVVDWLAGTARSAEATREAFSPDAFDLADHVTVRGGREGAGEELCLRTRGLHKLGRPELELPGVPPALARPASELLIAAGRYALGAALAPGETIALGPLLFALTPAGEQPPTRALRLADPDDPDSPARAALAELGRLAASRGSV